MPKHLSETSARDLNRFNVIPIDRNSILVYSGGSSSNVSNLIVLRSTRSPRLNRVLPRKGINSHDRSFRKCGMRSIYCHRQYIESESWNPSALCPLIVEAWITPPPFFNHPFSLLFHTDDITRLKQLTIHQYLNASKLISSAFKFRSLSFNGIINFR